MALRKWLIIKERSGGWSDRLVSGVGQISGLLSDRLVGSDGQSG